MTARTMVMSEQEYVLSHGGDEIIGQGIFIQSHVGRHEEGTVDLMKRIDKIMPVNSRLRCEYWRLVSEGAVRPYTQAEILKMQANGHEDNDATWAARRCCRLNASPATVRHPDHPNTDHRYKGVRFYYESDFSTWSAKIYQPK